MAWRSSLVWPFRGVLCSCYPLACFSLPLMSGALSSATALLVCGGTHGPGPDRKQKVRPLTGLTLPSPPIPSPLQECLLDDDALAAMDLSPSSSLALSFLSEPFPCLAQELELQVKELEDRW